MRLTFRQGIARYQTDIYSTPTFLQKNGEYVSLIVSPDPTIIIFAHKKSTYVVEESKSVPQAWGPFTGSQTRYLYWDLNLLDASLTRGATTTPQIVSASAPSNPVVDQHWFDKSTDQMKVWNGTKWLDKLRVFAGTFSSSSTVQPSPLGTQANETGDFDGGAVVLDAYKKPLRQSDGTFVTSSTQLTITNASTKTVKVESEVVNGMADEYIPRYSFVQIIPNGRVRLARSDQWRTRIMGVVTEDLYDSEVGIVETGGLIRNEQWHWPATSIGRPVFSGITGEITTTPPLTGVNQIGGYVFSSDSIFVNIQPAVVLDDIRIETATPPPVQIGNAPVAQFTSAPKSGSAPLMVEFTSTSLHGATSYAWDFKNDGTIDAATPSATYTYTQPGTYTVRLRVKNPYGEDEIVKTGLVTVTQPAQPSGIMTNLDIQLSAALQVAQNTVFPLVVTISNAGLLKATNVTRTIIIDDVGTSPVVVSSPPTGSTVSRSGAATVITLPKLAELATSGHATATLSLVAPNKVSLIKIRAGVLSAETDSTLSDNATELSIKVK